jgi:hypothetical protein
MNLINLKHHNEKNISIRLLAGMTAILLGAAALDNFQSGAFSFSSMQKVWVFLWCGLFIFCLGLFILSWSSLHTRVNAFFERWVHRLIAYKWFNLINFGFISISFSLLVFGAASQTFHGFFYRLAILWLLSLLAAFFLKGCYPSKEYIFLFFISILFSGAIYQASSFLRDLTTYSFSQAWSEGSRFYYASLPFSRNIYGQAIPWSFLHPGRYLLMAIPFIINNLPLWVHRSWQIFLWVFLTGLGCLSLVHRFKLNDHLVAIGLTAWSFIFFLQGPIYYHLMICAILVLWGFDVNHIKKSLLFIILASLWAGICRVNWFPVPAALAILLYVMEKPFDRAVGFWNYLRVPILFGIVGICASLFSQAAYIPISGNQNTALFTTSFSSDLLWYRLLPSPTYPFGILTGLLILISPLLYIWFINFQKVNSSMHWIRKLIITGILLVFMLGGLVVSVKIGGGSNLHNLDAFLLLLTVFGFYLLLDRIEKEKKVKRVPIKISTFAALLLVLIPIGWAELNWEPFPGLDKSAAYQDLQRLTAIVQKASMADKQVLFISERHLLTLKYIRDLTLVPDYELLTLMEMSISHNQEYLDRFYQDLKNQRFSLIVMDKQYAIFKDDSTAFPEENNAWVKSVAVPILEYYQPITWLRATDTEVYAPRNLPSLPK